MFSLHGTATPAVGLFTRVNTFFFDWNRCECFSDVGGGGGGGGGGGK